MLNPFDIAALAGYRHCYFVLRADHASKPGGDVDLAHQIGRAARAAGAVVSIVGVQELPDTLDSADLLFLFNIDRPYEAVAALDRIHPDGRALLYPLHHPDAGVAKYLRRVVGAKRLLALLAGGQPSRYEALVDAAKAVRTLDMRRLRVAASRSAAIRHLMKRCELLVTSQAELAEIGAHHGYPPRGSWLLPHPVAPYVSAPAAQMPRYVLVPGRIEPRKNQHAALQTLITLDVRDRGYDIVMVGGRGSDAAYFNTTIDFAMANGIIYVSQLPKALFFPAVSGAALVVNASFFEVTSLIDLYAGANGIPLLTTMHGYYASSPLLRQVDPLAWGASPAREVIEAIDALLDTNRSDIRPAMAGGSADTHVRD